MTKKFACSVCLNNCRTDCIFCETCQCWVHYKCQSIDKEDRKLWQKTKLGYIWLDRVPSSIPDLQDDVALVEYIGTFPERTFHGCVKHPERNTTFVRTKKSVRERLGNELKFRDVKDVERRWNNRTSSDTEKQRNEKQLRNIKYKVNRDSKPRNEASNNLADHIVSVEEMTKNSSFVQSVKHINGLHNPVITLYTEQQITDIKRFCCVEGNGNVLGIDKTYNLGEFHVTPTVFKDLSVVRRSTQDHPITFGPTFIHQSSSAATYSSFLHDIADNLTDSELAHLTIGSDEELSFKNAIKRCFHGSTHVLCTRHLKQNTNKYLEDVVGYPVKQRSELLTAIFGSEGLVEAMDVDVYETRLGRLRSLIDDQDRSVGERKFLPYFEGKLVPLLIKHVIEPARQKRISTNWTNNNCESANHILKSATKWKLCDIPEFIRKLEGIVESEKIEKCRAIRDTGNYALSVSFLHHLSDIDHWANITQEQRDKREKKFLRDTGRKNQNVIISADGTRTAVRTPSAGRKPHQTKMKRAERSRTPSKASNAKRRCMFNSDG